MFAGFGLHSWGELLGVDTVCLGVDTGNVRDKVVVISLAS